MKKYYIWIVGLFLVGCKAGQQKPASLPETEQITAQIEEGEQYPFQISLSKITETKGNQSGALGVYDGQWVVVGGKKNGFHGLNNSETPFLAKTANDSIWVINPTDWSYEGVPIPMNFKNILSSSNPVFVQDGEWLYVAGGFTRKNLSDKASNWTSNVLVEIHLPKLISYVQSGGVSPSISEVFTKVVEDDFLQVTGGQMFKEGELFYMICGQNYEGAYTTGNTGKYTQSIRSFTLDMDDQGKWEVVNKKSLENPSLLHRRDLNVFEIAKSGGDISPMIYGGVFTSNGSAFRNALFIDGYGSQNVRVSPDTIQWIANQYECAHFTISDSSGWNVVAFLGGITYQYYNTQTQTLDTGQMPLPFSNVISCMYTDGSTFTQEWVQTPQNGGDLMPGFLGSNAYFIPNTDLLISGSQEMLDLTKLLQAGPKVFVGYMYGGIKSMGPTSGATPSGYVNTYVNNDIYEVYLEWNLKNE